MKSRDIQAGALLLAALTAFGLFCVSVVVTGLAYFETTNVVGTQFFRFCSSAHTADCATFTWVHLATFCFICLALCAVLAKIGVKRWKAGGA